MATTWKSPDQEDSNNKLRKTIFASLSRSQKIGLAASAILLAVLFAVSVLSDKTSDEAAAVAMAAPALTQPAVTTPAAPVTAPIPSPAKKSHKKRPTPIITYRDPSTGVSFRYSRKYVLASGDNAQPEFAGMGAVPMNFVQPGGIAVATVALPKNSYPGTDFASAFFAVSMNPSISEKECGQFAFVDTRNPDGEPVDAEKVKVGSMDMEKTSDFTASTLKQAEAQYYHRYEKGACYEFVLGLGTAGYGAIDGIEPVNRDEVFARLEKILGTVKITPVEPEQVAVTETTTAEQAKP
jgi:hypothetical protein